MRLAGLDMALFLGLVGRLVGGGLTVVGAVALAMAFYRLPKLDVPDWDPARLWVLEAVYLSMSGLGACVMLGMMYLCCAGMFRYSLWHLRAVLNFHSPGEWSWVKDESLSAVFFAFVGRALVCALIALAVGVYLQIWPLAGTWERIWLSLSEDFSAVSLLVNGFYLSIVGLIVSLVVVGLGFVAYVLAGACHLGIRFVRTIEDWHFSRVRGDAD